MIQQITWEEILPIWKNQLWPDRASEIEKNSAMRYLRRNDTSNMHSDPTFFGYIQDGIIVGVNSGHSCINNYRSRGLWVDTNHRNRGIGKALLIASIEQGRAEGFNIVWSYPRSTSWPTYKSAGFKLSSNWTISETSEANAFCYYDLRRN
jgi:GNAT superfamily N-acetyltransferase